MRILFAGPCSAWVRYNLLSSLRGMGHDLVAWDWGMGWPDMGPGWRERRHETGQRLARYARRQHRRRPFDLVFCYLYATVVGPETIDELRTLGPPVVNFSCNNVHQFDLVAEIAPRFDRCIVPERSALGAYQAAGATTIHLGMAANPAVYRPYPLRPELDVSFVGQRYADRAAYVLHLKRHGVDVRVWGAGWRKGLELRGAVAAVLSVVEDEGVRSLVQAARARLEHRLRTSPAANANGVEAYSTEDEELRDIGGHRLLHQEMVRLFSRSRISLGFATVGDTHRAEHRQTQVRLRDFEAPMSGAFYITEAQDELQEYFEPGRELETYADQDELLDKTRFYLQHPERAEAVRQAGRARALAEHTWEHRFAALFRELGLE